MIFACTITWYNITDIPPNILNILSMSLWIYKVILMINSQMLIISFSRHLYQAWVYGRPRNMEENVPLLHVPFSIFLLWPFDPSIPSTYSSFSSVLPRSNDGKRQSREEGACSFSRVFHGWPQAQAWFIWFPTIWYNSRAR